MVTDGAVAKSVSERRNNISKIKPNIMKNIVRIILVAIATIFASIEGFAQPKGHVDERFELTMVVFRLTGVEAFTYASEMQYVTDVDSYFAKFKNHELIEYVKRTIHSRNVLNLYLPVDLAGDTKITPKGIALNDAWNLSCDGSDSSSGTWTKNELKEYVRLLDKFYKETRFHSFFVNHSDFYS